MKFNLKTNLILQYKPRDAIFTQSREKYTFSVINVMGLATPSEAGRRRQSLLRAHRKHTSVVARRASTRHQNFPTRTNFHVLLN